MVSNQGPLIISHRDFRQSKQLALSVSQTFVKLVKAQNTLVLVTELLGWVYWSLSAHISINSPRATYSK